MRQRLDWFATARARIGWPTTAICSTSPAARHGVVSARPIRSISRSLRRPPGSFARTLSGSAIGGGIAARVWGDWTAKVEYLLHLNLGSITNIANLMFQPVGGVAGRAFTLTTTSSVRDDIIRIGVNAKFAGTAIDPAPAAAVLALPVKAAAAVWSWTGFYLGINGGYGVRQRSIQPDAVGGRYAVGGLDFMNAKVALVGGLFGGRAGYNWQTGHIVLGIEGDAQLTVSMMCRVASKKCTARGLRRTPLRPSISWLKWLATVRATSAGPVTAICSTSPAAARSGRIDETDPSADQPERGELQPESQWLDGGRRHRKRGCGATGPASWNTCTSISAA